MIRAMPFTRRVLMLFLSCSIHLPLGTTFGLARDHLTGDRLVVGQAVTTWRAREEAECMFFKERLFYQVYGQGQPIYFLHGMSLSQVSMSALYEQFPETKQFRRYYVDLPGMGQSQNVTGLTSSDQVADLLAAFITATAGNAAVILVGHSYGGYLCDELATRLQHVGGVFTTCPVVIADSADRHVATHRNQVVQPVPDDGSAAMQGYRFINVVISPQTWQAYQTQSLPGQRQYNRQFWDQIKQSGKYSLEDEAQLFANLAKLNIPIYTILGRQDNIVGYQDHLQRLGHTPNQHVVIDDHAGHALGIDDPGLVARNWQSFLGECRHA